MYVAKSDKGKVRETNQDSYWCDDRLYIVADGMGGCRGGELASKIAVTEIESYINPKINQCEKLEEEILDIIIDGINAANMAIYKNSQNNPELDGMGTTVVAGLLMGGQLYVCNVGDSRAYIISGQTIKQITTDNSLIQELIDGGKISAEEAAVHPQKNIITRAVGCEPHIEIDTYKVKPSNGDIIVMCSDGLSNMVGPEEISQQFNSAADLDSAVSNLIDLANCRGGLDNITVVAFTVENVL